MHTADRESERARAFRTVGNVNWKLYWDPQCSEVFFLFSWCILSHKVAFTSPPRPSVRSDTPPPRRHHLWLLMPIKIRACSTRPAFPRFHILPFVFFYFTAPRPRIVCTDAFQTRVCAHVDCLCALIAHNWSWYQSSISLEGLTKLLKQPRKTWYRRISQIISPLGCAGLRRKWSHGHESYV